MSDQGYYRYPTIFDDSVIFVSEGDLWRIDHIDADVKTPARRLTHNKGVIKTPVFSPDGSKIAFSSSNEGHSEVYIMNSQGGELKRLTYLGDDVSVHCWTQDGIFFSSSYGQPFLKWNVAWCISPEGGVPEKQSIGPANFLTFKDQTLKSGTVIQRHGYREYGYWKRYRGGTAGDIWVDTSGKGKFEKLVDLKGDLARPLWVAADKIVFSSDHEGVGNLYSCTPEGKDLKRLTNHTDFYVRNQMTDGKRVVYHAGADLYVLDLATSTTRKLDFAYHSDRQERSRKFFSPQKYLQYADLHPKGTHLSVVTRGKVCTFGAFDGPVIQFGEKDGIRYRMPTWLADGKRILVISDDAGDESLEIYDAQTSELISKPKAKLDIGRVLSIYVNPKTDSAIITNHRSDILYLDLTTWKLTKVDNSDRHRPGGGDWSPDGRWFAYASSTSRQKMAIHVWDTESKSSQVITDPLLIDESPVFDPEGKFLYFLSHRHYDPVYDAMHFEKAFVYGTKIMALPLDPETDNPFLKSPSPLEDDEENKEDEAKSANDNEKTKADNNKNSDDKSEDDLKVNINFDRIFDRILEFPIEAGDYSHLCATKGRIYYLSHAVQGAFEAEENGSDTINSLETFDFDTLKTDGIASGIHDVDTNNDKTHLITREKKRLRVFKAGTKPEDDGSYTKKTGWIDLSRISLMVTPAIEWHQMYKEAWRLQRDHYWVEDMADIDWQLVFDRYLPLVDRASTRDEFTDIVWEMQGELGTSHAYSYGGDLKVSPRWAVGSLGADFEWDAKVKAYRVHNLSKGEICDTEKSSPLLHTGINMQDGDYIFAINKEPLTPSFTPYEALMNKADDVIELEVAHQKSKKEKRTVYVKTVSNMYPARYRDWVEHNRQYIHEKTNGRVGYIHIPDMSNWGFAEFHRSFLQEIDKEGLVVDVRFNGGGNVSQLLLEKLARRRLGYDVTRWHGMAPYPDQAPMGPMVALTNEYAGSDGDMFSHNFKTMKLGPLIGKRTWGGVIGIWPRHGLVDGGMTTQPEFSFWFKDVGWAIENYGVDPDIVVEYTPQDYANNKDPQIDRGLFELDKLMADHTEEVPTVSTRPSLPLPSKLA